MASVMGVEGPRFAPKIEDIHRFQVYMYIYIYKCNFFVGNPTYESFFPPQQIPDDGTSQAAKKDDLENVDSDGWDSSEGQVLERAVGSLELGRLMVPPPC